MIADFRFLIEGSFNNLVSGTGKRISIKDTRAIIDRILDGSIDKAETKTIPVFNLEVPTALEGVDSGILDPRDTYADAAEWDKWYENAKDVKFLNQAANGKLKKGVKF